MKNFLWLILWIGCVHADCIEKHVQAHIDIKDLKSALQCVESALEKDPENEMLLRLKVSCLAKQADTDALVKCYRQYRKTSENPFDSTLVEELAWAVIQKASQSPSVDMRKEALVAAFMANEARSIDLFLRSLEDPSNEVRLFSLSLATKYRDDLVLDRVYDHFLSSRLVAEKIAAINVLAAARFSRLSEKLVYLLHEHTTEFHERLAAICALTHMHSQCPENEILTFFTSNRSLLRATACQLVLERQQRQLLPLVFTLIQDSSQEVRLCALQTVGVLATDADIATHAPKLSALQLHLDLKTALVASWVLLRHGAPQHSDEPFKRAFSSSDHDLASFAAGCLSQAGPNARALSLWTIANCKNPLVTLNAAIGQLLQRQELSCAEDVLFSALSQESKRLGWQQEGIFSYISASDAPHPALVERDDLQVKLDLIRMLACCNSLKVNNLLKPLLQERTWGVAWQAARIMLSEGIDIYNVLQTLLQDPNPYISLQAACILASETQDEKALDLFTTLYKTVPRQLKEQILMSLAHLKQKKIIPFLVDVLDEPSETLRVRASVAILLISNS